MFTRLCKIETLFMAWKQIKSKNSAGGIDGWSVLHFEENLKENLQDLLGELKERTWNPEPYLRVEIPKNENERRKLGLLSVRDKLVQQAVRILIEPRFERLFLNNSYGYRPGKGHTKAIRRVAGELAKKNKTWIVRLDIDDYFDTIDHEVLFTRLKPVIPDEEIIRLIELSVKMGVVNKRLKWTDSVRGVPQGAVLSPLLANFYLHPFDQFVVTRTGSYVRYADDFLVMCDTKEQAETLIREASDFLQTRLRLRLNNPFLCEKSQGIEFLGVRVQKAGIGISEKKSDKLLERIRGLSIEKGQFTDDGLDGLSSIKNYYAQLLPQEVLIPLDQALVAKVDTLISECSGQFRSRQELQKELFRIPSFSREAELNRKQQMAGWLSAYAESRKNKRTEKTPDTKRLVESKKKEYQKREGEGAELVVSTYGSFIGKNNKGIVVKIKGKQANKGPGHALEHITVVTRGVSISSDAIRYCSDNRIPVDFFDASGKLYASMLSPVSVDQSLWQRQALLPLRQKIYLASRIIEGKLKNQLNLAKYYNKYHKDDAVLTEKYEQLSARVKDLLLKIKNIEPENEAYAEVLISYEAAGATAYWSYVRQLLSDDQVHFDTRERKGAGDLFNSLLNYGYALLYARIWQAVLSVRLNPSMGVLHAYQAGKPVLVFDLIELFRAQAVDRVVIGLIQKGEPLSLDKSSYLEEETKKLLIRNILERMNRYEAYRGREIRFMQIFKEQAKEAAAVISGETRQYKPYLAKW